MPKKVDHLQRRAQIAEALINLAARQGLEAVSLRHVAAEAGVSSGMVQHYFRTKDQMMEFALAAVRDHNQARLMEAIERLGPDPAPRVLIRTTIATLLPVDDEGRRYGRVALAFLAYTAVRPEVSAGLGEEAGRLIDFLAGLMHDSLPAGVESRAVAAASVALMEGLGVQLLGGYFTPELALAALDAHLDLVFPPAVPGRSRRAP